MASKKPVPIPKRNLPILCVVLGILCTHGAAAAKEYSISRVKIEAQLRADGSMEVRESRTYQFDGSFSFAFRTFPTNGPVAFEIHQVSEGGQPYTFSTSGSPGTYEIIREGGQTKVQWYFRAENEARTFDVSFTAKNAVLVHDDTAVLYYQFISGEWNVASRDVQITLIPPQTIEKEAVNEWLHGPPWASSVIEWNGTVNAWCEQLPAGSYLEMRALYPPELFPSALWKSGSVRGAIMEEEARWALEANKEREAAKEKEQKRIERQQKRKDRQAAGKWATSIAGLAGLLGWIQLKRKYGTRPTLPPAAQFAGDIPQGVPPALVDYLLKSRQITGGALISTLLDLAKKGVLSLHEETEQKKGVFRMIGKIQYTWVLNRDTWNKKRSDYSEYENSLVAFLFDDLAGGSDRIDIQTLQKKQYRFMKFFQLWKKQVEAAGKSKNWYDLSSLKGMVYAMGLGGVMLLLTVPAAFLFGPWAVLLGLAAFLVFILSFAIMQRTQEGQMLANHWKALKRYLMRYEFRTLSPSSVLPRLDDYLVYGAVLGVGKKVYHDLAAMIPPGGSSQYVPWYVYSSGTGDFSPASFATAFSNMMATTMSAMSTASGTGGGASSGGGGGASSGGGGAG